IIGSDIPSGMLPQVLVPAGVWQGTRLLKGGSYALMGTTVSPGFDYSDFEIGTRKNLLKEYPVFSELILALTVD
ncbi:MAG: cupin domain-containing protein, partial [Spirochaetes bacterium]|nr:cupin domain-containing protein [Spirochaetota bacterium]